MGQPVVHWEFWSTIVEAGGKIHVEEQDVPGMGTFSLFEDPDGRVLGIWKQTAR